MMVTKFGAGHRAEQRRGHFPMGGRYERVRRSGLAAMLMVSVGACSYLPEVGDFKLPSTNTFIPTNANAFNTASVNTTRPVALADLIDGQGLCAGMGVPAAEGGGEAGGGTGLSRGVGLDMTECDVVRVLGQPQSVNISADERGERSVLMTYAATERAGFYRFARGRLVSIERGPEPPPPPKPEKKPAPAKKQAKRPA